MSRKPTDWQTTIAQLCQNQSSTLLSRCAFQNDLLSLVNHPGSLVEAIGVEITRASPFGPQEAFASRGEGAPSDPTEVFTFAALDDRDTRGRVKIWRSATAEDVSLDLETCRKLVDSYWKGSLRDDKSNLISFQNSPTYDLADGAIRQLLNRDDTLAVLYCDLDRFKQVNDTFDHAKGDQVILEFSALLEQAFGDDGVVLHRSGDEFSVLLPGAFKEDALLATRRAMKRVATHNFDVGEVSVGISAGIVLASREDPPKNYKELEELAEKAISPGDNVKYRGRARLASSSQTAVRSDLSDRSLASALCAAKANPTELRAFTDPWLNVVSLVSHELATKHGLKSPEICAELRNLVEWIGPEIEPEIMSSAPLAGTHDGQPKMSYLDIAFATAHGMFRAGLTEEDATNMSMEIRYNAETPDNGALTLQPNGIDLFAWGTTDNLNASYDLGAFVALQNRDALQDVSAHRGLLIKIGHSPLLLPQSLFDDVLVVDDRPTRGGGLPDFWESTIARLISRVAHNPNLKFVYVLGDVSFARETVQRLQDPASWTQDLGHFAYKTGMGITDIHIASGILDGAIKFCRDSDALQSEFACDLKAGGVLVAKTSPDRLPESGRFLERRLDLEEMALRDYDGCRVATISEAFPVVVEIARQLEDQETIVDQAGQELKELVDFKVHLTSPLQDTVPAFYRREAKSLEEYSKRVFVDEQSLFGTHFRNTGQFKAVIEHVASAIRDPLTRFATRRATLIVPHEIRDGEDLAPLGLISVRIIPRFRDSRTVLHFSFTWRTVEALVGFPYSLYGSVRFAEHLTSLIEQEVGDTFSRHVEMGQVSYIAHSLHIFVDDYGQNIARRIVDDASL